MKQLTTVCEVALIGMSILVLVLPEARTAPMDFLLRALLAIVGCLWFVHARKVGFLHMTPRQTFRTAHTRPRTVGANVLSLVAIVLSLVATIVPAFR